MLNDRYHDFMRKHPDYFTSIGYRPSPVVPSAASIVGMPPAMIVPGMPAIIPGMGMPGFW